MGVELFLAALGIFIVLLFGRRAIRAVSLKLSATHAPKKLPDGWKYSTVKIPGAENAYLLDGPKHNAQIKEFVKLLTECQWINVAEYYQTICETKANDLKFTFPDEANQWYTLGWRAKSLEYKLRRKYGQPKQSETSKKETSSGNSESKSPEPDNTPDGNPTAS